MNSEEYAAVQAQLVAFAAIVNTMPLAEFITAGQRAMDAGPFLDPTLYQKGAAQLDNVIRLARALRPFQAEVYRQVGENAGNER